MNKREVLNKQVFAQPSITIKKTCIHFFYRSSITNHTKLQRHIYESFHNHNRKDRFVPW